MRVLVTGGAGFVGSHLVDRCIAEGHHVDVVDDLSTGSMASLADARGTGAMTFHRLDVRDPTLVDLVQRRVPDVVWHCAGRYSSPGSMADPVSDAQVNVLGVLNVLEAVRAHEGLKVGVIVHGLYRREEPTAGRTLVGQRITAASHVATEAVVDYVRVYSDIYGVDGRVLACSNVYGPRQRATTTGPAIARFVAAAARGEAPVVDGDGTQRRDFVHIDDVVDAAIRAHDLPAGSIVPIGSGTATSVAEVARLVTEQAGGVEPQTGPPRPHDRPGIGYPIDDAARRMGWKPFTPLADGVRAMVENR